jgi:hypothetical protein
MAHNKRAATYMSAVTFPRYPRSADFERGTWSRSPSIGSYPVHGRGRSSSASLFIKCRDWKCEKEDILIEK